jgi:hypothetical protein
LILFLFTLSIAFSTSWGAGVSGSLRSSTDQYAQSLGEPTETLIPYGQLEIASKHKFTKRVRTQWKLFAMGNFEAEGEGSTEKAPFNEQAFVDLPEAYLEGKFGLFKLRAGMNTVNWGVVDGYSPSNVVNTSAYFHPLRSPKRGSPMVETQIGGESLAVHALYIPIQPRAILPATDSRWLPREFLFNLNTALSIVRLADPMEYSYGPEIELSKARQNNFGGKLSSHLGSFDFQITHFDGASPFPKIRPSMVFNFNNATQEWEGASPARLDPVTYRSRTTGAGATYAGENWIYRLEGAYTHVTAKEQELFTYGLNRYSWTAVAGAETNFEFGRSTMTVLAQYYHSEFPTKADNQLSSSFRLFDRTAVLGVRWPFRENWTANVTGLYETQGGGLFWTAGFEQKLKDALKWGLGWRDFSAREDGLIKTFDKNDHANLDVTYFF